MTYVEAVNYVLNNVADLPVEVRDKLVSYKDKETRVKPKHETPKQRENNSLGVALLKAMENGKHLRACEWVLESSEFTNMTSQRMVAILKPLVAAGAVAKAKEHGDTVFFLNAAIEVENAEEEQ